MPRVAWFAEEERGRIVAEAIRILEELGVFVECEEAKALLHGAGARVDGGRAFLPASLVEAALATAPPRVLVHDRAGEVAMDLGGDRVHFNPGSAALRVYDAAAGRARPPTSADAVRFARLTDALPGYAAQSTGVVPADVPESIADRHRLFLALRSSTKPVVTGTFAVSGFAPMRAMLAAVAGGEEALRARPNAIFDCCPSPPLRWSELTARALMDCARAGLPAELVSMPMTGATAPVTLAGAVAQHAAENLSGVAIHQLAAPGAPIVWGGSPACFDMRKGTTPMGAVETMMIDGAYVEIGKHLGLPTHAYLALSDAKLPDWQAGAETGMGAVLAAVSGVNNVSGPGMLDFESCQSEEKLVLDHELCRMALRLSRGIEIRDEEVALPVVREGLAKGEFLSLAHTVRWFREEAYFPDPVVERGSLEEWEGRGRRDAVARASARVRALLAEHEPKPLAADVDAALREIMAAEARAAGVADLPGI